MTQMSGEEEKLFDNVSIGDVVGDLETLDIPRADAEQVSETEDTTTTDTTSTEATTEKTVEDNKVKKPEEKTENIENYFGETSEFKEETTEDDNKNTEKTEKKVEDNTSSSENPSDKQTLEKNSSSPYSSFAKVLSERGVLADYTEDRFKELEEGSDGVEALEEMIRETIESNVNNYKESLDEDLKDVADARDAGVSLDEYKNTKLQKLKYSSITEDQITESEDLQKNLVTDELVLRGYKGDEIVEQISMYEETGKLGDKAIKARGNLEEHQAKREVELKEQAKVDEKNREKKYKAQMDNLREEIDKVDEIIPGKQINKRVKNDIFNSMIKIVGYDDNGKAMNAVVSKRAENPTKWELTTAYLTKLGVYDWNFDEIAKIEKSNAAKDFASKIEKDTSFKTNTSSTKKLDKQDDKVERDLSSAFKSV